MEYSMMAVIVNAILVALAKLKFETLIYFGKGSSSSK
jgi:hypothetical protein